MKTIRRIIVPVLVGILIPCVIEIVGFKINQWQWWILWFFMLFMSWLVIPIHNSIQKEDEEII